MSEQIPVLVWLPLSAEPEVVTSLDAADGVRVARRCADLAELIGSARAGLGAVVVLAHGRGVDRARLSEFGRAGVRTVLVCPAEVDVTADAAGADEVVFETDDLARMVTSAVLRVVASPPRVDALALAREESVRPGRDLGQVIAVWSGAGAPGRSTIAAGIAGELAALGVSTFLVDADTCAPSQSQAFSLLEESSAIAALCRAAGHGELTHHELERRSCTLPGGMWFISGLTRADRWREVVPEHLQVMLDACRGLADWTVVDVAAGLEAPPSRGPDRHGATRCVLEQADVVIVVAAADPVGIRRGVLALGELEESGALADRRILLNANRPVTASGMDSGAQALERFGGCGPHWRVPYDGAVAAAMLAGRSLVHSAPRSAARRALAGVASELALASPATSGGRRALRLRR